MRSSIYPFFLGLCLVGFFVGLVVFFKTGLFVFVLLNLVFLFFIFFVWVKDFCYESLGGYHNFLVVSGFKLGFVIFLGTEVLFFGGLFWVFYDNVFLWDFVWWPLEGGYLDCFGLSFFATMCLYVRGLWSTWAHHCMMRGKSPIFYVVLTVVFGGVFLGVQVYEYFHLFYDIRDGWAGRIFFFMTGFHGLHVLLGLFLMVVCLFRLCFCFCTVFDYFFLEARVVYWHFVDVVWLFLYVSFYV